MEVFFISVTSWEISQQNFKNWHVDMKMVWLTVWECSGEVSKKSFCKEFLKNFLWDTDDLFWVDCISRRILLVKCFLEDEKERLN